jgi:hypothetical protein
MQTKAERIAFQDYIASSGKIGTPMVKDNDSDNVLFYTQYQGLYTTAREEDG